MAEAEELEGTDDLSEEERLMIEEEEAAFMAEFESEEETDSSNLLVNQEEAEKETPEPEKVEAKKEEAPAREPATEQEEQEAPGEPAAPDPLQELENRLSTRMRNIEGHFGGLKSELLKALKGAQQDAKEQGEDAPTQKEIREASQSSEKLAALQEDFPEWADALSEQVGQLEGRLQQQFNLGDTVQKIEENIRQSLTNMYDTMIENVQVKIAYPDWENTVKSDDFHNWKDSQDEEFQKLADSPRAVDAIKMLQAYEEYKKPKEPENTNTGSNKRRLAAAVTPTKGSRQQSRSHLSSEEQDFLDAFNE